MEEMRVLISGALALERDSAIPCCSLGWAFRGDHWRCVACSITGNQTGYNAITYPDTRAGLLQQQVDLLIPISNSHIRRHTARCPASSRSTAHSFLGYL